MDPFSLAFVLAPQLYKGVSGYYQGRQRATAQLPGEGVALNRIEAGTNDTLAAATRAGTSSSSIMGLLSQTDQNRQRALADLGTRVDAVHQQQERDLGTELQRKAAHEQRDREAFERSKAALNESSQRNIYGALDGAAQIGAFALSKYEPKTYTGEGQLNSPLT